MSYIPENLRKLCNAKKVSYCENLFACAKYKQKYHCDNVSMSVVNAPTIDESKTPRDIWVKSISSKKIRTESKYKNILVAYHKRPKEFSVLNSMNIVKAKVRLRQYQEKYPGSNMPAFPEEIKLMEIIKDL